MKLEQLFENDVEHHKTLKNTGFWGKEGAGGVIIAQDTGRMLLGLRSRMVEQPHTWGGFGGAIDGSENPEVAAIREIREETGLVDSTISNVMKSYAYEDSETGFRYTNFIVEVSHEFTPKLNWENEEAEWFDLNNLPNNLHFGLTALLNSGEFKSYLRQGEE